MKHVSCNNNIPPKEISAKCIEGRNMPILFTALSLATSISFPGTWQMLKYFLNELLNEDCHNNR